MRAGKIGTEGNEENKGKQGLRSLCFLLFHSRASVIGYGAHGVTRLPPSYGTVSHPEGMSDNSPAIYRRVEE
jgi:hypothetical protein